MVSKTKHNKQDISVSIGGQILDSSESAGVLMSKYKAIFMDTRKHYEEAVDKARDSRKLADEAHDQSAGWGHKKVAIEGLQDAVKSQAGLSDSIIDLSKYQMDMTATLSKLKHATVMVSTINLGRAKTMQQELASELAGLGEETDDERQKLLRENVKSILGQINESIDIMQKQDYQARKIKDLTRQEKLHNQKYLEHDKLLQEHTLNNLNQSKSIQTLYKDNDDQDELLKREALRSKENAQKIESLYKENDYQDKLLEKEKQRSQKYAKEIESLYKENDDQDELLKREELRNEERAKEIESLYKENDNQDILLNQQSIQNKAHDEKINQLFDELKNQKKLIEDTIGEKDKVVGQLRTRTVTFSVIDFILVVAIIAGMAI